MTMRTLEQRTQDLEEWNLSPISGWMLPEVQPINKVKLIGGAALLPDGRLGGFLKPEDIRDVLDESEFARVGSI